MTHRLVTIVDTDVKLAEHLKGELARWGLTAEVLVDANELMFRKDDLPELVVLCIDPKRTGWAVCNRLRKSPFLKSVPLIITSAEATEKDFDDHKKLKTRAEEYLHKPFPIESLIDQISALIGIPAAGAAEEDLGEVEVEPEAMVEDGAGVEYGEERTLGGRGTPASHGFDGPDESTRVGFVSEVDNEVDLETNAAFAAIGLEDPQLPASQPVGSSPFEFDPFEPESTATAGSAGIALPDDIEPESVELPADAASEFDGFEQEISHTHRAALAQNAPADFDSVPVPRFDPAELGVDLDDIAHAAAHIVDEPVAAQPLAAEGDLGSAALDEARREIERLRRELDDARAKAGAATSSSREREFLTLRETINQKEREVLDLKDGLDARDRLVLEGNEKLRDAERKLHESEERALAVERVHVAAKEALSADRDEILERETQTKAQLADAQATIARAEQDAEAGRQRHAADKNALDEKLAAFTAKNQEDLYVLRQSHAVALADQEATQKHTNTKLRTEHEAALTSVRAEHEVALAGVHAEHEAALVEARSEHQAALDTLRAEHEIALGGAQTEREAEVSSLRVGHAEALSQAEARYRADLETELRAAERRQGEALVDVEARHEALLTEAQRDAEERLRAQAEEASRTIAQAAEAHREETARLEAEHARRVEAMGAQHQQALDEVESQATELRQQALADQTVMHEDALKTALGRAEVQAAHARRDALSELAATHDRALAEQAVTHEDALKAALAEADAQAAEAQQRALADQAVVHEDALKAMREQHARKLQAIEETQDDLKAGMTARHATQVKELREQHQQAVTEYDAAITERDSIIAQQRQQHEGLEGALADEQSKGHAHTRHISELEAELEIARNDVEGRVKLLADRDARIAELEQESARYQDQILRAYQRIKSDESTVQRAKKALAIALTLLEESDEKPESASS